MRRWSAIIIYTTAAGALEELSFTVERETATEAEDACLRLLLRQPGSGDRRHRGRGDRAGRGDVRRFRASIVQQGNGKIAVGRSLVRRPMTPRRRFRRD